MNVLKSTIMKWNSIVVKAMRDCQGAKLLQETSRDMQKLLDFVMEVDPDVYFEFKGSVLRAVNGSENNDFLVEEDNFIKLMEGCG